MHSVFRRDPESCDGKQRHCYFFFWHLFFFFFFFFMLSQLIYALDT